MADQLELFEASRLGRCLATLYKREGGRLTDETCNGLVSISPCGTKAMLMHDHVAAAVVYYGRNFRPLSKREAEVVARG